MHNVKVNTHKPMMGTSINQPPVIETSNYYLTFFGVNTHCTEK